MKIEYGCNKRRKACAVIPTMDMHQLRVRELIMELDLYDVDSLLVEDRLPEFRFSKSMNAGIKRVIDDGNASTVILSNDDIGDIRGLTQMIHLVGTGAMQAYAVPLINKEWRMSVITTSRLEFIYNLARTRYAPFHAIRVLSGYGWITHRKHFAMGVPALPRQSGHRRFAPVQPFAVFPLEILKTHMFDENFINGLEDDELGYRLWKDGISSITSSDWNVSHKGGASFRAARNGKKEKIGLYLCSDEEMIASAGYFWQKHFGKKTVRELHNTNIERT